LANCSSCGISNLGPSHAKLVIVDGQWFCEDCLPKKKGRVKCAKCGREPFTSDDHFKTVNGQYMCTDCMEAAGIIKKYDYIMQSLAGPKAGAPSPSSQANDVTKALGGLKILLDENLSPGESVTLCIQGNAGEAIACSRNNIYVLKSGLAVGSITGRKCSKYSWSQVSGIEVKAGNLYGLLEIKNGHLPSHDPNDITKAKKSDNAITFLLSRKPEFDQAVATMQSYLHR